MVDSHDSKLKMWEGHQKRTKAIRGGPPMKKEYDFSKGERGNFYHPDAEFHIPIYLDPDLTDFIQLVATKKN